MDKFYLLATASGGIYENTFKVFSPYGQLALLAVLNIDSTVTNHSIKTEIHFFKNLPNFARFQKQVDLSEGQIFEAGRRK